MPERVTEIQQVIATRRDCTLAEARRLMEWANEFAVTVPYSAREVHGWLLHYPHLSQADIERCVNLAAQANRSPAEYMEATCPTD